MTVIDEALVRGFEEATLPVDEARLLPPVVYTSPEFYEFERNTIFERDWLCVGRMDEIPAPGDYMTITLVGEPLVVVRDKDGDIRVLSAVCRHRGMVLAEGRGRVNSFLCPYHHWVYGTDGRLLGCPEMDSAAGFDKQASGLPSLPVETWNGFIFTSFSAQPDPLTPGLHKLTDLLANFHLDTAVTVRGDTYTDLPWNWKVMLENFNDGYHANRLHQGIGDFVPGDKAVFLEWDDADCHITRLNYFTHIDGSFNPTTRTLLPVFPDLTEDERWRAMFALVPPTLGLAIVPDSITYFIVNPSSARTIDIHIGYCLNRGALDEPLFDLLLEQTKSGVNNFNVQDIWADTMVQRGLQSRFAPRGRYSWQEETLRQFNRWLVRRYRAGVSRRDTVAMA
jgi:phenylpropionate dioxygenase-like ring-hydroxylating dioxygenase large terminal subunit